MAQRIHSPAETASTKSRYRVTNWPDYNRALVSRGEVTLWTLDAVLSGWRASGGKGKRYSDPVRAEPSRGVQDATAPDPGFPWPGQSAGPAQAADQLYQRPVILTRK